MSEHTAWMGAGRQLGVYQVQALIGAGGMGEVYRARDTKLERDVAMKFLPRAFMSDPERLARFEREARMLAALNHPNIGAIYGTRECRRHPVSRPRAGRRRNAGGEARYRPARVPRSRTSSR